MDLYGILGIAKTATADDITKAVKKMSMLWHPDRFINDAAKQAEAKAKTQDINEAKRILTNEKLRPIYDRKGYAGVKDFEMSGVGGGSDVSRPGPGTSGPIHHKRPVTADDLNRFFNVGGGTSVAPVTPNPSSSGTGSGGQTLEERRRLRREQMQKENAGPALAQRFNTVGQQILTISSEVRSAASSAIPEAFTDAAKMELESAAAKARQLLSDIEDARRKFKR